MKQTKTFPDKKTIFIFLIISFIISLFFITKKLSTHLIINYQNNQSTIIKDRNNEIIFIEKNKSNYYTKYINDIPPNFKNKLLQKEDKYFYYHPGINPISTFRAFIQLKNKKNPSSSTITQQLTKILLKNEFNRNFSNKFKELLYALSLEIHLSKNEILKMYQNSIYLGNNIQGIELASQTYFNKKTKYLNNSEISQLVETIKQPSKKNPFQLQKKSNKNIHHIFQNQEFFELNSLNFKCQENCQSTIDLNLTKNLRKILKTNLNILSSKNVANGAIVVIKIPENEILAIIGTPDPTIDAYAYKINMAAKNRPIGSTIKPFIYTKGFENNLRPYSKVIDQEYKYTIGSGFAFYPKNYDYQYRGKVNLHYALSNSLNVPTVKVLEYVGLENFYNFLLNDLEFLPIQNLENYQLGIALGGLEMDLLSLSYYFTVFPNQGYLKPLKIYKNKNTDFQTMTDFNQNKKIFDEKYIQLTNKILNDRLTGIDQFGQKSELNLVQKNYALKTGTSREYHDSWTIGYTPDYLVGVWLGNADDSAMDNISGASGAGRVWQEAMNLLINSQYNKKSKFDFSLIEEYFENANIQYGLKNDDFEKNSKLLLEDNLILNPHNNDIFLLEENTKIFLEAKENVEWFVDDVFYKKGKKVIFEANHLGEYKIKAIFKNIEENLKIHLLQ